MPPPIRHLPVVQNWDCHVCGTCCKEYVVRLTEEERQRIIAQGWEKEPDFQGVRLFNRWGPPWRRTYSLNHLRDGSCVFLSDKGRCRIHERFGYEAKPLPCRLYPFLLIPADDHWRVGLRFACPSAAGNLGRPLRAHDESLTVFARMLAEREKLPITPDGFGLPVPPLQSGQRVAWPELLAIVRVLVEILRDRRDTMERRLRKCVALVNLARQARFDKLQGSRLVDFFKLLVVGLDGEVAKDPASLPRPSWIGRIFFRQAAALFARKDQGPRRGEIIGKRLRMFSAAIRFARGRGPVPRINGYLPEATFERLEEPAGPLPPEAEEILERYYTIKVHSLQFFGPAFFGYRVWDGFDLLAFTLPIILWVARMFTDLPRAEAITRALTVVDDHFGFNRLLGTRRQYLSLLFVARRGDLEKLIAWYSR